MNNQNTQKEFRLGEAVYAFNKDASSAEETYICYEDTPVRGPHLFLANNPDTDGRTAIFFKDEESAYIYANNNKEFLDLKISINQKFDKLERQNAINESSVFNCATFFFITTIALLGAEIALLLR